MPDTEADRIIRQRRLQQQAQEKAWQVEQKRENRARELRAIEELRIAIPQVLQLLAELGYPYMQEVRFSKKVPWYNFWTPIDYHNIFEGNFHFYTKAGWPIAEWETPFMDGTWGHSLWLLSDGDFRLDNAIFSLSDLKPDSDLAQKILSGLSGLRRKLEMHKLEKMKGQ